MVRSSATGTGGPVNSAVLRSMGAAIRTPSSVPKSRCPVGAYFGRFPTVRNLRWPVSRSTAQISASAPLGLCQIWNTPTLPPGIRLRRPWKISPSDSSVTASISPPSSGTLRRPPGRSEKYTAPSGAQPEPEIPDSANVRPGPPSSGTTRRLPPPENATSRPSGESANAFAPSVPPSGSASRLAHRLIHSCGVSEPASPGPM